MKFNKLISFLKGMGSIYDLIPPPSEDPFHGKSDAERLQSDWENIGNDIRRSMSSETKGKSAYGNRNPPRYNKA